MRFRRWLQPGHGRQALAAPHLRGMLLLALGAAHVIRQVTQDIQPGGAVQAAGRPRHAPVPAVRAAWLHRRGVIGVALIVVGRGGWP